MKKMLITNLCCSVFMLLGGTTQAPTNEASLYYYYGYYPQNIVEDDILYDDLYFLSEKKAPDFLNWYHYGDNYYACVETNNVQDERYFHNGQKIVNNRKYFFLCEKVEWVITTYDDHYALQATKILDLSSFYESVDSYEYETAFSNSTIYGYLNDYMAPALEKQERISLNLTSLNHDSIYINNEDQTAFKVNLPVYENSLNENKELVKECTDYALAKGINFSKIAEECVASYWMSQVGSTTSKMLYVTEVGETIYNCNIHTKLGISPYVEIVRR